MSFLKGAFKWVGNSVKKFLGKDLKISGDDWQMGLTPNTGQMMGMSYMNDIGFSSGKGTIENPVVGPQVELNGPKSSKSSTSNWFDKALAGVNSATALIGVLKKDKTDSGSTSSDSSDSVSSKLNEFLKKSTDGVSVQTGLDTGTKVFLGVGGALALYFLLKKR